MSELKRELGVWSGAAIVIGTVIGSGIFLTPKNIIVAVGSIEMAFFVWIFAGLLTLAGALTYAEMAAAMPEAGGEYVYLREAYGPFWGYLFGWTQMWVAKSGSIATLATAFFYYLANFRPELEQPLFTIPVPLGAGGAPLSVSQGQLLAMAVILFLAVVNYFGVRVGGGVQVGATIVKVGLLAIIIFLGFGSGVGNASNFTTSIPAQAGIAGFFTAMVAALWTYDGWNNVAMVSSEVKNPRRTLPLALIAGTLFIMLIYLSANAAYVYVLSAGEVAASDRVAAEMMRRVLGASGADWASIAAMISIFAALNGSILSGSRIPYAMARDGLFFRSVARVHPSYHTPGVSILLLSSWAALLVLSGRYDQLFTYVIFSSWILYGMAAAAVIVLRLKRPEMDRPYRTLGYPVVPVLFVLVTICLIVSTLYQSPRESIMGLGLIAAGVPFYFHWKKKNLV